MILTRKNVKLFQRKHELPVCALFCPSQVALTSHTVTWPYLPRVTSHLNRFGPKTRSVRRQSLRHRSKPHSQSGTRKPFHSRPLPPTFTADYGKYRARNPGRLLIGTAAAPAKNPPPQHKDNGRKSSQPEHSPIVAA